MKLVGSRTDTIIRMDVGHTNMRFKETAKKRVRPGAKKQSRPSNPKQTTKPKRTSRRQPKRTSRRQPKRVTNRNELTLDTLVNNEKIQQYMDQNDVSRDVLQQRLTNAERQSRIARSKMQKSKRTTFVVANRDGGLAAASNLPNFPEERFAAQINGFDMRLNSGHSSMDDVLATLAATPDDGSKVISDPDQLRRFRKHVQDHKGTYLLKSSHPQYRNLKLQLETRTCMTMSEIRELLKVGTEDDDIHLLTDYTMNVRNDPTMSMWDIDADTDLQNRFNACVQRISRRNQIAAHLFCIKEELKL